MLLLPCLYMVKSYEKSSNLKKVKRGLSEMVGVVGGMVDRELIHLQQGSRVQLPTRFNNFLSGGQSHSGGSFQC